MADNTRLNLGNGGDSIRTEDVGPYKIPVSKIYVGAQGVDGGPVTPGNPLPVSVVAGPAVQAVSAAALPLPAGAATAAKQPSFGASGSAAADVLSVQGIAGMTPLRVDGSGATQPVSGTVAISGPVAISGVVSTNAGLVVGGQAVATANPMPTAVVGALPAGSNTIGGVIAQLATGAIYNGAAALTPKFAAIAAGAAGDNAIVAAVAGKKIRVLKYTVVAAGAVGVKFRSPTAALDLTGAMSLAANSGVGGAFCPAGLFETATGDALALNLSTAAAVGGHLTYIEV